MGLGLSVSRNDTCRASNWLAAASYELTSSWEATVLGRWLVRVFRRTTWIPSPTTTTAAAASTAAKTRALTVLREEEIGTGPRGRAGAAGRAARRCGPKGRGLAWRRCSRSDRPLRDARPARPGTAGNRP